MKHFQYILPAFIFLCFSCNAQLSVIKGEAENMPNELVRVIVYSDNFSHIEKTMASTYTDQQGFFNLQVEVTSTSYAFLALGLKKGEFYLKPGAAYEFIIPVDEKAEQSSVFDELPLYFTLNASDDSLNELIGAFNNEYNSFLLENSSRLYRSNDKSFISDFANTTEDKYGNDQDEFFKNYRFYTLASLEWLSKKKNNKQIIKDYFIKKPILEQNIQYADFFNEFYKNYFASTSLFSYADMVNAINSGRGFIEVDRLISREETLVDEPFLRELIGILLIARKYHSPDVKKKNVMGLLNEIHRNSKSAGNSLVAGNTILKLRNLAYGTQAPSFNLKNQEGDQEKLSDYHNQFVLLYFTRSDCKLCMHYFQNLDRLKKEFNGKLEVVTIVCDEGFDEAVSYAQTRSYDWPLLNLEGNILLLEAYDIRTYPSIVLVNPNSTIASATAPMPDEGLDFYIKRFVSRYEKENQAPRD